MQIVKFINKDKAKKSADKCINGELFEIEELKLKEEEKRLEKTIDLSEDFEITEIPSLTVKQYVVLTIVITIAASTTAGIVGHILPLILAVL